MHRSSSSCLHGSVMKVSVCLTMACTCIYVYISTSYICMYVCVCYIVVPTYYIYIYIYIYYINIRYIVVLPTYLGGGVLGPCEWPLLAPHQRLAPRPRVTHTLQHETAASQRPRQTHHTALPPLLTPTAAAAAVVVVVVVAATHTPLSGSSCTMVLPLICF